MTKVSNEQIFRVAQVVLAEKGFDQARLAEIARRLNITAPALYKHFSNKEELYDAALQNWIDRIDAPVLELAQRAAPEERLIKLHDWLWQLAENRVNGFLDKPAMARLYEAKLRKQETIVNPRMQAFAEGVELMMAWDTFRQQRGLLILQTFLPFFHPYFASSWEDALFKTLFESTWIEIQPILTQDGVIESAIEKNKNL
ncbi:TetR/AcrR family transcriptional regulator [Weissella ceti]|uniref:TetR/AcrR family transcriptional regulator n=1 Tax=Weissella ceti TaxID=759620 RepID=A0ABT3E5I2_9LACO|nr:TetR/AcrR family transcriptional regulator [Weissella ceti]MCW0953499.1 TetR/AcrR family transcriptional regulator [Weissella ceti]QVK12086.1 TetR/AcrR family transcriptional regulator [Weissella ceti]